NDEAGDVVFAVGVKPGHLSGLAADQSAAVRAAGARDSRDDLLGHRRRQAARGEVIEEEQRLGALYEDVVHAVVHEVGADGVVAAGHERDLQLGANAIGARYQHRLTVAGYVEAEEAAERPDVGEHAGRECAAGERTNPANGFVPRIDIDARPAIVDR